FPSVAGPLGVVVALALAAAPAAAPGWPLRRGLPLLLPLPALAAVALTFALLVYLPVTSSDYHLKQAQVRQTLAREKGKNPETARDALLYLRSATDHLQEARKEDPTDVAPLTALASWTLETAPSRGGEALRYLDEAKRLDPRGKTVRMMGFQADLRQL